jgi:hypothetical protein
MSEKSKKTATVRSHPNYFFPLRTTWSGFKSLPPSQPSLGFAELRLGKQVSVSSLT